MPTIRYQIRNEYGLADPELHRAADKDDPEAILEGVAMAGLVGVLRQLGDLSEFAAEIFHDLHEEVMGTAARGHGLMLRVQQLEAEVPLVEKAILSQSGHSNYAYNDGIDWHCNIHTDQNIITQGDMPRFVLDSYEECCGPPRLFTLDKFDTAGAGACLKRYTDPSFFKMDLLSSGLMETEIPREKKSRKTRKKGSRWKNGQTLESLFSPQANPNSQPTTSDQVAGKSVTRPVRLKPRNLNEKGGDTGGSLRKGLLQLHSDYQKVAFDNSKSSANANPQPIDSSESTSEMQETFMDVSANHPLIADGNPTMKPSKDPTRLTTYELHDWMIEGEEFSGLHEQFAKGENPHKDINFVEGKEMFTDSENNSEGSAYDNELSNIVKTTSLPIVDRKFVGVELKLEGGIDGYRTEDIGSEQENFMDALNIMEFEAEMDSENKGGLDIDILRKETHKMNVDTSEAPEQLQTEVSEPDGTEVSPVSLDLNNVCKIRISKEQSNSAETSTTQEKIVASDSSNLEFCLGQTHDENSEELLPNDEVAWLTDGASNTTTSDNPILRSRESIKEHCSSYDATSTSDFKKSSPCESFEALQSVAGYQDAKPANHEAQLGSDQTLKFLDGSPYPDQCFTEKTHPAGDVEEDRITMPGTFHHLLCSPNRIFLTEDTNCEDLLLTSMPIVEEMQDLVDQEIKAFSLKEDNTSSGKGSISTAISDFGPAVSMDDIQHDEISTGRSNCQYLKVSTTETSSDYVKRTDDIAVAQNVNGPDQHIPEKPDFACKAAEPISGEMTLNHDLSDYLPKTNDESTLVANFAHDIEVPSCPSNVTIGKPLESMNRYTEVCLTETPSSAVPVIAAISTDGTAELKDTVVENLEVGFENADDGAKSDLEMSNILQPQMEYYSETEESQESPKVNSAEELQESSKVNLSEQLLLHPESGTFPDRTTNSPMLVDDNSTMSNEFIQDSPHGNVQDLKDLTPENSASEDETNYSDPSVVNTQDATGHQLRLFEDSADIPYQYQLKIHEACSPQTTEACQGVEESTPEPAETCLECPVQDFDSKCVGQGENLTAENFASKDETNYCDLSLVYTQEAAGHGLQLLEDSTDVPYQYQLKTHETFSLRTMEAVDSQSTLNEEVCPAVEASTPEPAQICLECPVQYVDSKCLAQGDHENAKQEICLSTNFNSIPSSLPEEFSTSQASNEVKVELEFLDQMAERPKPAVPSNSMDLHDKTSEGVEPNYHAPLSNLEYDDLNISTPNAGKNIQHSEAPVLSESSSEISACHVAYNISGLTFPSMSSSDISVVESTSRMLHQPHSDETTSCFPSQNSEEPPPLPPLPPLGWRSPKLHLNSILPDDNSFQSSAGANPFMMPSGNKTVNPFLAAPIVVDQSHQLDSLSFSGNNLDSSKVPSLISSSLEHEKSLYGPEAEEELRLPLADSFAPLSLSESQISQHSTMHEERIQSVPDRLHNQSWPGLELEKSHYSEHTRLSFEKEMVQSQNPFLVQSTTEDENHHHSYGDFGGENVHLMKPMELSLSSGLEMPQPGFVYSLEGSQHTIFGVGPTKEDKLFGVRPRSIRNRPRNPLMEAVVAHDRSTLRKVSEIAKPDNESEAEKKDALLQSNILQLRKVPELVKPSNNSETEGKGALLEQIRNKSFSLKPAVVAKSSNKSHSTNITVAAIVEKANALRQAMAGSDEEDAGDSWSDC